MGPINGVLLYTDCRHRLVTRFVLWLLRRHNHMLGWFPAASESGFKITWDARGIVRFD